MGLDGEAADHEVFDASIVDRMHIHIEAGEFPAPMLAKPLIPSGTKRLHRSQDGSIFHVFVLGWPSVLGARKSEPCSSFVPR